MSENGAGAGRGSAGRGLPVGRVVKIALLVVALGVAALVAVAVLNPEPQPLRVDYGGFND